MGSESLLAFLALRAVPGVEVVDGTVYRRALGGRVVAVDLAASDVAAAAPSAVGGWSRLIAPTAVNLDHPVAEDAHERAGAAPGAGRSSSEGPPGDVAPALAELLAGAHADVIAAEAHLGGHPVLGPLVRATPGLRVPGHPDGAELAVRAVLGQQVSVAGARTLAGRLVTSHGAPLAAPAGGVTHSFPTAAALATIDPKDLPMPRARGRALVGLGVAVAAGDVDLSPGADPAAVRAGLLELRGIGPWTADYVVMRAQRAPDVLLVGDLGVRHALTALGVDTSPAALRRLADELSPWGSYATIHLWESLGRPV